MSGLPCARCGAPMSGASCGACGAPRLVAKSDADTAPSCALHPDRLANGSCSRCGAFGCGTCLVVDGGALRCRSCRANRLVAPWAHVGGASPRALVATAWSVCVRPGEVATELRRHSTGSGLAFALLVGGVGVLMSAVSVRALDALMRLETAVAVGFAAALVVWVLGLTLVEWLVLRGLGVPARLKHSLQAASYSLAPLAFALVPCACVPLALLWSLALRPFFLLRLHRLSALETVVTVATAPVVLLLLGIVLRWDIALS